MIVRWLLALLIFVGHWSTASAGFSEGAEAFRRSDYAKASKEFLAVAEKGNADAQGILGYMYDRGLGLPEDKQQAAFWWRKAAEQGVAMAQFNLAVHYNNGEGVPKDPEQAAVWHRMAAEQGLAIAQFNLGVHYRNGDGVQMDGRQAAYWWRKAAWQGHAEAQFSYGQLCDFGQGMPMDQQEAAFWYGRAAEQGVAQAQHNLGVMYANGRGVSKDERQSVFWWRKAAEQGHVVAQFNLGEQYALGSGVPRNNQLAYFWWLVSAAHGSEDAAKARDRVERALSPESRTEAQAAARDWQPKASVTEGVAGSPVPGLTVPPASGKVVEAAGTTGSGFRVARERVVTNYHVAGDCRRLRVAGQFAGRLLAGDTRNDLAIIAVEAGSAIPASIRVGRATLGEPVTVAGFPLSGLLSGLNVTTGNISSLSGIRGDTRLLQITAPVQAGNSGGPLLDAGGNVIGVVVSKLDAEWVAKVAGDVPQNVNFAINANTLASFLDANGIDYKSAPLGAKLPTQEVARRAQAFTVSVECWR